VTLLHPDATAVPTEDGHAEPVAVGIATACTAPVPVSSHEKS